MAKEAMIICVGCPLGCEIKLTLNNTNEVTGVDGNKCKEGKEYALEEYTNPVRTLTATVLTKNSTQSLLPVRTNKPILKTLLVPSMAVIAKTIIAPPVKMGDIVIPNILDTGVDVIASSDLLL